MTRQRRLLVVLLFGSIVLCGAGSFLYVQLDRLRSTADLSAALKRQYARIRSSAGTPQIDLAQGIEDLARARDQELSRYYERDEIDLYRFGSAVNALLARRAIVVERFRTVTETTPPMLDLSARGSSTSLMAFLSDVSSGPKYWTIPYLHIQSPRGDGSVTFDLQIGYLVHDGKK